MVQVKRLRGTARPQEQEVSWFQGAVDEPLAVIQVLGARKERWEMGSDYRLKSGPVGAYRLTRFIDSRISRLLDRDSSKLQVLLSEAPPVCQAPGRGLRAGAKDFNYMWVRANFNFVIPLSHLRLWMNLWVDAYEPGKVGEKALPRRRRNVRVLLLISLHLIAESILLLQRLLPRIRSGIADVIAGGIQVLPDAVLVSE